jgi:hypothetical protein
MREPQRTKQASKPWNDGLQGVDRVGGLRAAPKEDTRVGICTWCHEYVVGGSFVQPKSDGCYVCT